WEFGLYQRNPKGGDSLLFRSYRRLVETGAPTGRINYLFLHTGEPLPRVTAKGFRLRRLRDALSIRRWRAPILRSFPRLLGTLCYTPGRMILFFPGFPATYLGHYNVQGKTAKPFAIDHFSLEPKF